MLKTPLSVTEYIRPICLPAQPEAVNDKEITHLSGKTVQASKKLSTIDVKAVPYSQCKPQYVEYVKSVLGLKNIDELPLDIE